MPDAKLFVAVLGEVIADRRREVGLSQEQLGYRSRITPVYVSEIERGRKSLTVRKLLPLAAALKTVPSELLREAERRMRDQGVELGQVEE